LFSIVNDSITRFKVDHSPLSIFKPSTALTFQALEKISNSQKSLEHVHIEEISLITLVEAALCYDPSYAPMLVAMLVAMLMTIAGRSPLGYRVVPRPTLFRVSLCSPESYR